MCIQDFLSELQSDNFGTFWHQKYRETIKLRVCFSVFYPFNYILVLRRMINSTIHFETVRGVMDNSIILNNIIIVFVVKK